MEYVANATHYDNHFRTVIIILMRFEGDLFVIKTLKQF